MKTDSATALRVISFTPDGEFEEKGMDIECSHASSQYP
jgi:hypothetical protein